MLNRCSALTERSLAERFKNNYVGCFIAVGQESGFRNEVFPRQSIVLLHTNTPLGDELLPPGFLSTMIICALKGEYDEEQLLQKLKSPAVTQLIQTLRNNAGASLANVLIKDVPSEKRGQDSVSWQPSLSADSYVSISSNDIGRYDKEFSLVLYTGNPTLERDLKAYADKKANDPVANPYTLGRFSESLRHSKALQLAQRNAEAAAAQLAKALGVRIELKEDLQAVPAVAQIAAASPCSQVAKSGRPLVAKSNGLSMFNHLFRADFQTDEGPQYKCVAIYTGCGNPSCGVGEPVFPINPVDGVGTISGYKPTSYAQAPTYTASDLCQTLPCGAPFAAGTPIYTVNESRYVSKCLSSSSGTSIEVGHAKLARNYMNTAEFLKPIGQHFDQPGAEVRILRHAASTV